MDSSEPKKPFTDPKLVVYGDIQQITQSVGTVGAWDRRGIMMGMMGKMRIKTR